MKGNVTVNNSQKINLSLRLANNKIVKLTIIAATLASLFTPAIAQTVADPSEPEIIDLGSLTNDNSGYSSANGVSANGKVVVGHTITDSGSYQAFRYVEGDANMTGLGTLQNNNIDSSYATGVSADGRVVIGSVDTASGYPHAFRYSAGDAGITDLGTLRSDNSGTSSVSSVSADGRVVVGSAQTDDGGVSHAYRHNEGDARMTDLGTLKSDNSGFSFGGSVSADGRVVVGSAENDNGFLHAFRHNEGDVRMTDLGTLRTDNSGLSFANAVSTDGRVVVGSADNDSGFRQAFWHSEGDARMTDLGTLKSDNSGESNAFAVSADGRVVVGISDTDIGSAHATIWKFSSPNPTTPPVGPTEPPVVTIVDKDNSHQAMAETGKRGFKVLDLYQSALTSLGDSRCQIGQSDYCVGVFSQLDNVNSNQRVATGVFGSLRLLPSESWTAGGAVNFANYTKLTSNYDTRGESYPGIALFTRYQQNRDNSGFSAELSGAFLKQGITITRDQLQNTEAGEGNSRIKGYQAKFATGYGIYLNDNTLITPNAALIYRNVERDAYSETDNAEFAATYGHMGNKRTDLHVGIHAQHNLTSMFQLDGEVGTRVKLNAQRDAFTGQIDYIGAYAYEAGRERTVNPYAQAGINFALSSNSTLHTDIGWQQTDYRNDALQVGVSYSYHW